MLLDADSMIIHAPTGKDSAAWPASISAMQARPNNHVPTTQPSNAGILPLNRPPNSSYSQISFQLNESKCKLAEFFDTGRGFSGVQYSYFSSDKKCCGTSVIFK